MEPKDKAKHLYSRMMFALGEYYSVPEAKMMAKECAYNAIDEIIEVLEESNSYMDALKKQRWEKIKQELERI